MENQILLEDPPDTRVTIERLQAEGYSRHQIKGAIARLISVHIFNIRKHKRPFDTDQYVLQLRILGKPFPEAGRNDRCPCGSGRKFKRCCQDFQDCFEVDKFAGRLVLGTMGYASAEYLGDLPHDDKLIQLENRVHIARYLEEQGDVEGARMALEENLEQVEEETDNEGWLENALYDLQNLCLNHPNLAELGLQVTDRLIATIPSNENQLIGFLYCDRADFLHTLGKVQEVGENYKRATEIHPEEPVYYERWLAFLENTGQRDRADEVRKKYEQLWEGMA